LISQKASFAQSQGLKRKAKVKVKVIGCLRLSDVSVICRVVNPRRTLQKIWGGLFYGVYYTGQENDFELIPTVEIETRNPVHGYFGSKFPTIYNHCRVMAARSSKTLKIFEKMRFFWKNDPLR